MREQIAILLTKLLFKPWQQQQQQQEKKEEAHFISLSLSISTDDEVNLHIMRRAALSLSLSLYARDRRVMQSPEAFLSPSCPPPREN